MLDPHWNHRKAVIGSTFHDGGGNVFQERGTQSELVFVSAIPQDPLSHVKLVMKLAKLSGVHYQVFQLMSDNYPGIVS